MPFCGTIRAPRNTTWKKPSTETFADALDTDLYWMRLRLSVWTSHVERQRRMAVVDAVWRMEMVVEGAAKMASRMTSRSSASHHLDSSNTIQTLSSFSLHLSPSTISDHWLSATRERDGTVQSLWNSSWRSRASTPQLRSLEDLQRPKSRSSSRECSTRLLCLSVTSQSCDSTPSRMTTLRLVEMSGDQERLPLS